MTPIALTIAGSDPSGGAGLQADLKTFHQFGVYGEAVVTLITVQNTRTVDRVEILDPALVGQQLDAVIFDIPPNAAKTGALGNATVIEAIAARAARFPFPLVVDPVMISKHGAPLLEQSACTVLLKSLLPKARLITPNLHEAAALTGRAVERMDQMADAARALHALTGAMVLLKGGHLDDEAQDFLFDGERIHRFPGRRIDTVHTHGTGCTYSAAITAGLARGWGLCDAVAVAKRFIDDAIRTNPGLGGGQGPVNHHARVNAS